MILKLKERYTLNLKDKYNYLIHSIIIMNIFDLLLTYIGLKREYIEEGNKVMAYLYSQNEIYFILIKVLAICYFAFALLKVMKVLTKKIKVLLWITFFVYSYITTLHIYILIT